MLSKKCFNWRKKSYYCALNLCVCCVSFPLILQMIALSTKLISVVLICNLKRKRQSKTRSLVPVYRCSLTKLFFFESLWHQMLNLILSILVCEFLLCSLQFETCRGFHVCLVVVDWQPLNSHGFRILNFCLKIKE